MAVKYSVVIISLMLSHLYILFFCFQPYQFYPEWNGGSVFLFFSSFKLNCFSKHFNERINNYMAFRKYSRLWAVSYARI